MLSYTYPKKNFMSISGDRLAEIYRQINESFLGHPLISVTALQGDPPEKYRITYNISGLSQNENDEIEETSGHTVELSIPLGFPSFPPSCSPKTTIYHPDFTRGTINIDDFWQQNPSITELIIHIGMMINGEIFSTNGPINRGAGDWYRDNPQDFPIGTINWRQNPQGNNDQLEEDEDDDIFILEEDDVLLERERDHDSTAEGDDSESITDVLASFEQQLETDEKLSISSLKKLRKEKKLYALRKALEQQNTISAEHQTLLDQTTASITSSEDRYQEAKNLEKQGRSNEALKIYQNIAGKIDDFPALKTDIDRITQLVAPKKKKRTKFKKNFLGKAEDKEDPVAADQRFPIPRHKSHGYKRALTITILMLFFVAAGVSALFYMDNKDIAAADLNYSQCLSLMKAEKYQQAQQSCRTGVTATKNVRFFYKEEVLDLTASLLKILNSERLKNGLEGKNRPPATTVSKKETMQLMEFQEKTASAEKLFDEGLYQLASIAFKDAVLFAMEIEVKDEKIVEELQFKSNLSAFKHIQSIIGEHLDNQQYQMAIDSVQQGQILLVSFPEETQKQYSAELQNLLMISKFELVKRDGDAHLARADWDRALGYYDQALNFAAQTATIRAARISEVENSIDRAILYKVMEQGNRAFAMGDWNEAVKAFQRADTLLDESRFALADQTKSEINKEKLNKIVLQASIIRDQQSIKAMLNNDELHRALDAYENLLELIENNSLAEEQEFIEATQQITTQIDELQRKIFITEKQLYLESNFQSLFVENYPGSNAKNLKNPVVTLISESNSLLIYRIQCTEKNRGRAMGLVLFYAYDKPTETWSVTQSP
jgi:ubiquitin-protein ligase